MKKQEHSPIDWTNYHEIPILLWYPWVELPEKGTPNPNEVLKTRMQKQLYLDSQTSREKQCQVSTNQPSLPFSLSHNRTSARSSKGTGLEQIARSECRLVWPRIYFRVNVTRFSSCVFVAFKTCSSYSLQSIQTWMRPRPPTTDSHNHHTWHSPGKSQSRTRKEAEANRRRKKKASSSNHSNKKKKRTRRTSRSPKMASRTTK